MKSKIKTESNISFPKLMVCINSYFVILSNGLSEDGSLKGTIVLSEVPGQKVGNYSDYWDAKKFVDFGGIIELSNQ